MFTIIVAFVLLSGTEGVAKFNRSPPLLTMEACEEAIPMAEKTVRDEMMRHGSPVKGIKSHCEAEGEPA